MGTYRLAWVTGISTLLLMTAGGLVHSTGSALACPDWPLCYGSAFPTMERGVFYEHGHRLLGAWVGLLTAVLAALLMTRWKNRPAYRWGWAAYAAIVVQVAVTGRLGVLASQRKLTGEVGPPPWEILGVVAFFGVVVVGIAAVLALREAEKLPALGLILGEIVVVQATLGGVTVLMKLPTAVSTTHLGTSMIYLCGVAWIVSRSHPRLGEVTGVPYRERLGVALAAGAVYLQMLLGALVRHTGAGLACNTDLFTCQGAWLPTQGPGWLLFTHRTFALVVAALVVVGTLPMWRRAGVDGRGDLRRLVVASWVLVTLQIILGLLTVAHYIAIPLATAHLLGAALLLVTLVALMLAAVTRGAVEAPHTAPEGARLRSNLASATRGVS